MDIEVWEYHEGAGYGTYAAPLNTLVAMVAGVFGGISGAPGDPGLIYNGVDNAFGAFAPAEEEDDQRPAAYLNYILFDADYNVLDMGWKRAPDNAFTKQRMCFPTLEIKHPGHLYVYLSYDDESNHWVFFDDFKVTHTPTNIIQSNEYYPFGLQTGNSWTREDALGNQFLYNGGTELNQTTGNYDLFFRGYDPALGRMLQIDPVAGKYAAMTPYNFAFNSPGIWNDPGGADPDGSAKGYYNEVMTDMYGEHWKEQRRNLGVIGDDDLFGRPGTIGFKGFGEWVTIHTKQKVWRPTSRDPRNMEWEYEDVKKFVLYNASDGSQQGGPIPTFRRINSGEDVSEFVFLELHGHVDLGAQIELTNTPIRDIGKIDVASVRLLQINLRFYYNHSSNEVLVDILSGTSSIFQDIANDNVSVYSTLALGFIAGAEASIQRSLNEFNFMWLTGEVSSYYDYDSNRDSWSGSLSVFSYNGGTNPTISATYGGSAALGLGFDGSISVHVPIKLFK